MKFYLICDVRGAIGKQIFVPFSRYFRRYITYADTYGNNGLTCLVSYEERNPSTGLMNELYIRKVFMSSAGRKRSLFSSLDCATADVSQFVIASTCARDAPLKLSISISRLIRGITFIDINFAINWRLNQLGLIDTYDFNRYNMTVFSC